MTGTTHDLQHLVNQLKHHLEEAGYETPRPPLEEFGYLKRTREPTDKGTSWHEQVVCDDPELQGEPPGPENPPESRPSGTGNPGPVCQ
ncbi:hypothetical protein [Streptomyces sp. NPDC056160]|uniref:hypothetical protein n=1 Tax=Streptomyces sp. NPDC056160 TaxID=3345731 RepID=UPI0035E30B32